MQVIKAEGASPIKAWVGTKSLPTPFYLNGSLHGFEGTHETPDIEASALTQLKNVARLPFIHKNGLAVMPDVHMGVGASIGSVIASATAVIPSAVGVDIGCGVVAIKTSLLASDLPDSLLALRQQIERDVPTGKASHKDEELGVSFLNEHNMPLAVSNGLKIYAKELDRAASQIGTLGGGNHFIEICLDEHGAVWVMLHSGSRGIGNQIGTYFTERAKELCARWNVSLPDNNLAFLPHGDPVFFEYIDSVEWAQKYALENRRVMLELVIAAMRRHLPEFSVVDEAINCHHNYIERENHFGQNLWVTRKGAVRARKDDLGIIPGSMGQKSYIVRGKGNAESYCSCSHGAGRAMSRTEARKRFSLTDLIAQTEGVECRKDDAVLDELPSGYKQIDEVMAQQADLVEVVATLKQVLCVKGA